MGRRTIIAPGERYGKLTVVRKAVNEKPGRWVYAECECGNSGEYMMARLRSGHTKSCGCARAVSYTHLTLPTKA